MKHITRALLIIVILILLMMMLESCSCLCGDEELTKTTISKIERQNDPYYDLLLLEYYATFSFPDIEQKREQDSLIKLLNKINE